MTIQQAQKAAKWWRDILEKGEKGNFKGDGIFQSAIEARSICNSGDFDKFESILVDMILQSKEKFLEVDYNPCAILYEASIRADLSLPGAYPWPLKTGMKLKADDSVWVKVGYGAEYKQI